MGQTTGAHCTMGTIQRATIEESETADYLERIAGPLREKELDVEFVVLLDIAGETIINNAQKKQF